ncbi:hypothetical protein CI102_6625 [Trichoderma harzianum]|nr:hypothetical protein CI102_6625 [Trichoderma harzianum]
MLPREVKLLLLFISCYCKYPVNCPIVNSCTSMYADFYSALPSVYVPCMRPSWCDETPAKITKSPTNYGSYHIERGTILDN